VSELNISIQFDFFPEHDTINFYFTTGFWPGEIFGKETSGRKKNAKKVEKKRQRNKYPRKN
jgi:hypothetical protein